MGELGDATPRSIPAVVIIHQEGVIGLIALIGLSIRSDGVLAGLAPQSPCAPGECEPERFYYAAVPPQARASGAIGPTYP